MDILTFLGLDYRVASLITSYFVVPGINIPKIRSIGWLDHIKICCLKSKKINMFKMDVRTYLLMIIELLRFLNRT